MFRYLIDPSFQAVNRLFVLSFEHVTRTSYKRYFVPDVEVKYDNIMINGKNIFNRPVENNLKTYNSI